MSFDNASWLVALPPLAVFFRFVSAWGLSGVGARQRRWALGIRIGLAALLVLSLAGFRLGTGGDRVAVVFLVDRSDSVGAGGEDTALDFVEQAIRAKRRGDLVAVVAFGKEPRLEFGMTDRPRLAGLGATPDASATDLARALRLAAALFGEGTKRRIVVLSDGRETRGDARREAERLARDGITIEGLTLGQAAAADTLIEAIDAPARARKGESYRVGVTVRSSNGGPAHLEVFRDGKPIYARDVVLRPGRTTVPIVERASAPGVHRYEARLDAVDDPTPQNDRGSAAVVVQGPPRVLVIEAEPGEAATLVSAMRAGGMIVDRRTPASLPALNDLLTYSATVLVDVPATALTPHQVGALRTAVADAGAGLVTIGGEDSYGLGGYRGSDLEALLPIESDIKDPQRRPSVAEALVIDTSGSMASCHCRGGAMNQGAQPGGINKTDISRAGAFRAIRALSADDTVGVLAFNTESQWVLPLQRLPAEDVVRQGLSRMKPEGGTNIPQALRTAVAELRQTKAKLKHIILFTDGWTNQQELVGVAEDVSKAGITLSVVATGEGTGDVLARMAEAGRGRFYAGTNLADVPQVMMQEAILASRNFVNEGVFTPIVSADTAITEALRRAPALLGYVATSPKSASTVQLQIGAQEDPLLASWRAGLGTVVSWTSDAKPRWARPWVGWDGFRDFWVRAVRSTFAGGTTAGFAAEARLVGDRLQITVASERRLPDGTTASARVVDPSLRPTEVELERIGPGEFRGSVVAGEEGTYLALVGVRDQAAVLYRDHIAATLAYSAEYLTAEPDRSMVPDLAGATGGRARITPLQAFDAAGLKRSRAHRELWPLLAFLAAFVLPIDIAARRLVVSREDLRHGVAALRARLGRRRAPGEREERLDRLLGAKERARGRFRRKEDAQPEARAAEPHAPPEARAVEPHAPPPATPPPATPREESPPEGYGWLRRRRREPPEN